MAITIYEKSSCQSFHRSYWHYALIQVFTGQAIPDQTVHRWSSVWEDRQISRWIFELRTARSLSPCHIQIIWKVLPELITASYNKLRYELRCHAALSIGRLNHAGVKKMAPKQNEGSRSRTQFVGSGVRLVGSDTSAGPGCMHVSDINSLGTFLEQIHRKKIVTAKLGPAKQFLGFTLNKLLKPAFTFIRGSNIHLGSSQHFTHLVCIYCDSLVALIWLVQCPNEASLNFPKSRVTWPPPQRHVEVGRRENAPPRNFKRPTFDPKVPPPSMTRLF